MIVDIVCVVSMNNIGYKLFYRTYNIYNIDSIQCAIDEFESEFKFCDFDYKVICTGSNNLKDVIIKKQL